MKREGIPFTSHTYSCLLQMHIRRKDIVALRTTVEELLREGINLDGRASEKAIKECVDQQPELVEDLLLLFREKGIKLESAGRSPLFPHWLKNGDFRRMEEEFEAIKEEGFTPSTFIHNTMINCFTKTHNWEAASKLLKEKPSFVPLDIWSYNQILNLWVEAERPFSEFREVLEEMKSDGISPDAATNGVIVKFFLGWPRGTVGQLYEVLGSNPVFDNYGYRALFCYLVKRQEWDRIRLEEKRMKDIGFVPNGFVYSYLFKAYKIQGNRDKLEELLRESLAQGVRLDNDGVYYALLNCFRDKSRNETTRYQVLKKLLLDNGVRVEIETPPPAASSFEWKKEPNEKKETKETKELNKKKEKKEEGGVEEVEEGREGGDEFLSLFSGGRRGGARKKNKQPKQR
jgi:pentatricopeptide repeat protein